MRRADFLFALDEHLDVHRKRSGLTQPGLDGLEVHEDLALVVGAAARVDLAVAYRGLEGRRDPLVQRINGLHVVVAVEEDGRRALCAEPFAVDDGIAWRLDQAHAGRPMRSSSSAVHSAHRATSPLCCGSALMLGIAR